jgi:hypothetical protein
MENNVFLLNPDKKRKSALDKAYQKYVFTINENLTKEEENRWELYSTIIELLITEGKQEYYKEIKYRLSDGENPNQIILDIIERELENGNAVLSFFKPIVEEYLEEDFFNRFLV